MKLSKVTQKNGITYIVIRRTEDTADYCTITIPLPVEVEMNGEGTALTIKPLIFPTPPVDALTVKPLREALERSVLALNDMLCVYAGEEIDGDRLAEARSRIAFNGGVLAYVADVQRQNKAALMEDTL